MVQEREFAAVTGLDELERAYDDDFPHALDNRLILNWYPQRILRLEKGGSLLELGVGHGYSSVRLSQHFSRHLVVEGSTRIIERFRARHPGGHPELQQVLFEDFFTEERFNAIVMGFVLEHVDDPLAILQEYRRFLKDDGTIFVAVPNGASLPRRIGMAAGMIGSLTELGDGDRALGHKRVFTLETLRELIASAGLQELAIEGLFLKTMTSDQLRTLDLSEEVLQGMLSVGVDYPELCVGMLMAAR